MPFDSTVKISFSKFSVTAFHWVEWQSFPGISMQNQDEIQKEQVVHHPALGEILSDKILLDLGLLLCWKTGLSSNDKYFHKWHDLLGLLLLK